MLNRPPPMPGRLRLLVRPSLWRPADGGGGELHQGHPVRNGGPVSRGDFRFGRGGPAAGAREIFFTNEFNFFYKDGKEKVHNIFI